MRSEGGITRWRNAERWLVIPPPNGSEYTHLLELVQWLLHRETRRLKEHDSAHQWVELIPIRSRPKPRGSIRGVETTIFRPKLAV